MRMDTIGDEIAQIPVSINYDIISLFSEGLYKSPHKAVEELVSNSYDAEAGRVHVLLPEAGDGTGPRDPLWVIDDGHGMNEDGFRQLWRVADSTKNLPSAPGKRAPIGQFGIGKLASYVLAWELTHISCVAGRLLLTVMDFHKCTGRRQYDNASPVEITLRDVDEATARSHLHEIAKRDPSAWDMMFGKNRSSSWTAAGLSDFKELYSKLVAGTLRWVLSTGLPLHSDFEVRLNGDRVTSSKEARNPIKRIEINDSLPGIGKIEGTASIWGNQLTTGKSEQFGRSHGFFVRVRRRVINLEDELFGIEAVNHAAWSRFALVVHAEGLRDYLLSSREGVRDCDHIQAFREFLLKKFNDCRSAYEEWDRRTNEPLEMTSLSDGHSIHITEPLVRSVRNTVEAGEDSFYIEVPSNVDIDGRHKWLDKYENEVSERPIDKRIFERQGPNAPALRYDPGLRRLVVNLDHPFVDKLTAGGKRRNPAKLFAASEVFLEGQLQVQGVSPLTINNFLRDRDRILRLTAGDAPPTAAEVVRRLAAARNDSLDLERAVGAVFRLLGFEYERKGGNKSGPDGILYARLGRRKRESANFSVVYDAKQTNHPSVPADKLDFASLEDFRTQEHADYGFFIANAYAAEMAPDGALNRRISQVGESLTLLKVEHLQRLVWLHYHQGITLTVLRTLFERARTVPDVNSWIDDLKKTLDEQGEVPVRVLLEGLERERKDDNKAIPNIVAVRAKLQLLQQFEPERLIARLKAAENIIGNRWIEVDDSGEVIMHHTAEQILSELERNIAGLMPEAEQIPETT